MRRVPVGQRIVYDALSLIGICDCVQHLEVSSTRLDTSVSRSVSGGWNATAICVIGDATVMWTLAGTAR